jgi:ABC-type multidrug transport system fused ATPase/permease subunit
MYFFVRYFSRFCVPVKRLEASTRSPIFSHLTSTIQGLSVIRCHGFESQFAATMDQLLDAHGKLYMATMSLECWLNMRVFFLASCALTIVLFLSIYFRDALTLGVAALSIVYAMTLTGYMQHSAIKVDHHLCSNVNTLTPIHCVVCRHAMPNDQCRAYPGAISLETRIQQ